MAQNGHDNRNKFKGLLIATAAMVALGTAGVALVTGQASNAQDKPAALTNLTLASAGDTATSETPAPTANTPAKVIAALKPVDQAGFYKPNFHRGPMIFRMPNRPALVQWALARKQFSHMRTMAKVNSFAARLQSSQGAELNRTLLPVLLPREGGPINTLKARMISFGDAYALNMPQTTGAQITMYGNRSFVPADKGAVSKRSFVKLPSVAENINIAQTEDGWTATWTRYGVVYSMDVSCDDPNDVKCQTDAYIRTAIAQFDDVTMGTQANAEADQAMNAPAVEPHAIPANTNWLDQVSKSIAKIAKGG